MRESRKRKWLLTITYQDESEKSMLADGRCFAFIADGFVVKVRREWRFYNADAKEVAVRTKSEIGECAEVSDGFFVFEKDGVQKAVGAQGQDLAFPNTWMGMSVNDIFDCGISQMLNVVRRFSADKTN